MTDATVRLDAADQPATTAAPQQDALLAIAEAASPRRPTCTTSTARSTDAIGELMDARNFYVALYDAERGAINFPYYVDTVDDDLPDPDRRGSRSGRAKAAA